jgi:hypothetical protein
MDSLGFFLDTGGQDEVTPGEEEKTEKIVEDEVMGAKDAQTEAKQRDRARTERSLSTFLFGKTADPAEEEQDDDSDTDSEDEKLSENESESDSENEDKENEEMPVSVQPTLPEDTFGSALSLSSGKRKRKAAWVDKEDSEVLVKDVTATFSKAVGKHGEKETSIEQYGKSLSRKFKSVVGEPAWASLDKNEDADSDDEFFRETTELIEKKGRHENLQKGVLQFRKLKDLNYTTHREGAVIRSTEFHPTSTVGMVAGNNGAVSLFQVDGKENPKIQTVNFQNFPIRTAKFSASGNEFIAGSQHHPHFYVYDMMLGKSIKVPIKKIEHNSQKFQVSRDGKLIALVGRFGYIHIISARTKEPAQVCGLWLPGRDSRGSQHPQPRHGQLVRGGQCVRYQHREQGHHRLPPAGQGHPQPDHSDRGFDIQPFWRNSCNVEYGEGRGSQVGSFPQHLRVF